ncbi:hypothetical protein MTR67_015201 [Solanum verrucosum]|uniref:Reverse transcriptase domain-containing protein n=1 Tax=Solanum verrucosum TaxID=315347 RepID=A0AAF0TJN4_SOLVR|nr:hypothetical protein MTR67_015201 [Solanum verrucosum]
MKEAQGSSGGIMILWDKRVWRGELLLVGSQCLTGKFSGIHDDFNWCITAVYADCDTVIRRVLWQELLQMKTSINGPWVVCGDFNVTRFATERTNCNRQNGAMTEFSACIEELEMVDPPLFGGSFTWRRGEDHNCASRIDRFLHCAEWGENFTQINQCSLPKIASDHNPIMLSCGDEGWRKSYFKFETLWLEVEGFKEKVREWWESFNVNGRPGYILAEKLKMLKAKLKEWSKTNKGNWKQRKEDILSQISSWETIQEQRPLTDDEMIQKTHLGMEFEEVAKQEEIAWKQRSRIQWLKQGDKNTKFFHRIATTHKRFNSMEQLEVEGEITKDQIRIKEAAQEFYKNLYKETEGWRPDQRILDVSRISEKEQKAGASNLKDFRPISLVGGVYKLIARLLAERLKQVLDKLINKHQMAFVKGRQIMDAALIVSECIDSRIKEGSPGLMCKLDIQKAFDHVNWSFLLNILSQMGFGDKWLKWIETCIKTVKFSVLVNGEPVGFFESERGLRQGDPLSPFLFILAMEGFNAMMRIATQNRWIKGFKVGGRGAEEREIGHMLYADDTIILCDPVEEQISYIRVILVLFEAVSGLKVNWGKSSLFPVNEVPQIKEMAGILGCSVGKLPTTYLGMPLGNNHKALEIWDGILEKTEKKLSGWKAQYLSLGGRLILINSVLDSLPTYVMSLFPIPGKVVENLDKLRRKFLWQGNKDGKGYSLVNWETALLSKDRGGLGIKNLKLQNESLLKKWLWRYTEERNSLWKEVIIAKYGELNPWCTEITTEPYGVGAWRSIRNLWSQMETNLYIKVGSGTKTKFWKDVWIDQSPLRDLFPDLFQICGNPDANVGDCWTEQGWDLVFRRLLNDWEVERVAEILGMLGGVTINANATDRMLWKHSKDGLFSVNSAYRRGLQVMAGRPTHLWNYFWKGDIPTKVKCFTWLVIKRACLTQEVLQKKGRQLVPRTYIKRVEELDKERGYQEPEEMVEEKDSEGSDEDDDE